MNEKKIKIQVVKGVEGYSLSTFNNDMSGTRVAGSKPWGGGTILHTFECDVDWLMKAIEDDSYEEGDQ